MEIAVLPEEGEVLYFNKPKFWTSFQLVGAVRYKLSRKYKSKKVKVGHAGTLDPLASGVMIICVGRATKRIESFQYQTKEYVATLKFGATTASFDEEKPIDSIYPYEHITLDAVEQVLNGFVGSIMQVPPVFSACKVNGSRAYDLARNGVEVELTAKPLQIDHIEILSFDLPTLVIRIVCSKGTYIRALARDIGVALSSGAHLTDLVRTRIGDVGLADCLEVEQFEPQIGEMKIVKRIKTYQEREAEILGIEDPLEENDPASDLKEIK